MKKLAKLAAAVALSAVVLGSFSTTVSAQTVTQEQELNQSVRVNCTTGAYGQNTTCTAEGSQNGRQSQTVVIDGVRYFVRNDGTRIRVHAPVNTSVDTVTMTGLIATAVSVAGAGLLTLKKRK
jgi:hypothetical protein